MSDDRWYIQDGQDLKPFLALAPGEKLCECVCRECAEGDHCGEGVQAGLGDCLYPLKERP